MPPHPDVESAAIYAAAGLAAAAALLRARGALALFTADVVAAQLRAARARRASAPTLLTPRSDAAPSS